MADTTPASSEPSTPSSSAAEQARIRKERREAKIKAGGSARLNKITGLGGGVQQDPPPQPRPILSQASDPEEVDISRHFYQPTPRARPGIPQQNPNPNQISDEQLRALMLGFPSSSDSGSGTGTGTRLPATDAKAFAGPNHSASFPGMDGMGAGMGAGAPDAEDPMLKMLQLIMGVVPGGGPGGMSSFLGMSPMGMHDQQTPEVAATDDPYAYLWRIVHSVFALGLGLYIALMTTFTGTKLEREMSALTKATGEGSGVPFFYIFATVEVLLQTSQFFMEKGRVQHGRLLGMIMGFLPEPWKGYLALLARYGRIWTTVSTDAMVCIFVLGVCSWPRAS